MKRIIVSVFAAVMTLSASIAAQNVDEIIARYPNRNPLKIPQVDKQTLSTGLRLYLLEDHSLPTVSASVRINCGSYLDPADKAGLADVCGEVMRTGGTTKWTGDQIDELLEGVGASVETGVDLLYGSGSMNALIEYTDLGLEVLAEVLQHPVFDQDKIELAKVNQRSNISRRNDDADQIGQREFRKVIYGANSPYARDPEYATISAITRDDLVAFHEAWFHPENVQIAIWGDFKKADMVAKINKYFGKWARGTTPVPPPPKVDYKFAPKVHYVEKNDVNQSKIFVGHIGGLQTDPNYPDVIVMNAILGGSFGSRLFNSVRSREGLAYAVFGVYTANVSYPGIFYNFASTKSETTGKAIREIIKEIKRMQTDAPTPEEMKVGKDGYLNSFVFQFESKAQVINRLLNYDFYGLPSDFNVKLKDRIETCTPEAVQTAAKALLHPDALQILVVGKGKDFEVPLADLGLGNVDTVNITIPSGEKKRELAVSPENLKKGKEFLDKAVTAHGGLQNFKNIRALSSKGTMTISTPNGDFPLAIEDIKAYPNQSKSVVLMMGQKIIDVNNGTTGWKTDPRTQSVVGKSEDDMIKDHQEWGHDLVSIFQNSDNPDYQAVYDGNGTVQEHAVEWVALVGKGGDPICRLGFSAQSGQLVCREFTGETMAGEGKIEEVFETFSDVSGVKLPSGSTRFVAGQKFAKISLTEVLVNPPIPAGSFDKPE
jgi:zinc protease